MQVLADHQLAYFFDGAQPGVIVVEPLLEGGVLRAGYGTWSSSCWRLELTLEERWRTRVKQLQALLLASDFAQHLVGLDGQFRAQSDLAAAGRQAVTGLAYLVAALLLPVFVAAIEDAELFEAKVFECPVHPGGSAKVGFVLTG